MTPEDKKELTEHINAIGKVLFKQTKPEQVNTLAEIEETARQQVLEHISPQIGIFYPTKDRNECRTKKNYQKYYRKIEIK